MHQIELYMVLVKAIFLLTTMGVHTTKLFTEQIIKGISHTS